MVGSYVEITAWAGGLAAVVVLAFVLPMACHAPIGKAPFRGCLRGVHGLLGRCKDHGRRPGYRAIAHLGGRKLAARRICNKCGKATVFGRKLSDGKPYLGCSGYPACASPRWLDTYRA